MDNSGPSVARGMVAAMAIAFVILVLRVIAKLKIHHFRLDDVAMIVALILSITSTVFLCLSVKYGFGQDLTKIPTHHAQLVLKYIAIQIPLVTISTGIARSSFVLYLLNILGGTKKYSITLWTVMMLQLICNIISAILPLSICRNVRILWDPTVKTSCGNVVSVVQFSYFSSSVNTATDLFLALFPTYIFWNLNLKLRIKITLIVLMSLGIVAMVASIIKTTKLDQVPSVTNIGATGGLSLIHWGYVENVIIIITSSVPSIRPLLISSVKKFSSVAQSRSYELSGPSANKDPSKNATFESGSENRYAMKPNEETGSIERILEGEYPTMHGRTDSGTGIVKKVDIEVVSSDDDSERRRVSEA
ncbi:hypothetical protein ASPWEDRAFT_741100 [Aspergillus wentii DTO 134E9]|uniref:Rhodopsin domain-containing protein n=1 Tax=Aspergillus wentii DTO 134E9 TaxID=1073089 RepID=A0A1L9RM90_ASPWE|nr:uncharacterized protein ASPWEDRAFT_741100 [Aspergillus wentii DTO 134E9]OJJ36003.1 hypothetical protein ASPWEDRAFT_741100 [Aspergillus wentii DTO 134E9]